MPRTSRTFLSQDCSIFLVLSIFKCNRGETNDEFLPGERLEKNRLEFEREGGGVSGTHLGLSSRLSCLVDRKENAKRNAATSVYRDRIAISLDRGHRARRPPLVSGAEN